MSFKAYIATRRVTDTPAGDFTTDAKADGSLPDASSWAELKAYLDRRGADPAAIKAARTVWVAYEAQRRRKPHARPQRPRDPNQLARRIVDIATRDD